MRRHSPKMLIAQSGNLKFSTLEFSWGFGSPILALAASSMSHNFWPSMINPVHCCKVLRTNILTRFHHVHCSYIPYNIGSCWSFLGSINGASSGSCIWENLYHHLHACHMHRLQCCRSRWATIFYMSYWPIFTDYATSIFDTAGEYHLQ